LIRDALQHLVSQAVGLLVAADELPAEGLPSVDIADPRDPSHGDFATNFALASAKASGKPPRAIAERLRETLLELESGAFSEIEVAGPGFLNFRLQPQWIALFLQPVLDDQLLAADSSAHKKRINVEFVSVNPNGPITVGSGRGAAYGDTLCRVLSAAGHEVHREYYVNDGVNSEQMRLFAESVRHYSFFLVYGEWGDLFSLTGPSDISLALLNAFFESLGNGAETAPEGLFEKYHQYAADASHSQDPDVARAARQALDNLDDPFYQANRPRQIAALYQHAYQDGVFSPIDPQFPEKGYRGDYVFTVAKDLVATDFDEVERRLHDQEIGWFQSQAQELMIRRQSRDLQSFEVRFDTWFSEQSLHESGEVAARVDEMIAKGAADEEAYRTIIKLLKGGAIDEVRREQQATDEEGEPDDTGAGNTLWLRSTKFGDDMDRVLRRRDGRLTYIASDVAYHRDKFNRPPNADQLVTILGPDHHGYIARLHAVLAALELAPVGERETAPDSPELTEQEAIIYRDKVERDACLAALRKAREELEVIIFQIVRFVKDGKPAPMRKRDGNIYELRDLIEELGKSAAPSADHEEQMRIGKDVARFFYLMRSHDTHMDFDIDLATKQSDENPVFYVQYAHARICSVLRKAAEALPAGLSSSEERELTHPRELALIKKICDLPYEVRRCAEDYGVHRLTTYAVELARAYHHFYDACRVIQPENPDLTRARLDLCRATQIALQSVFDLLGISAPERMERESPPA
jgi:arginyl-tRNA synthetase